MATLANFGRITEDIVDQEIQRLRNAWQTKDTDPSRQFLGEQADELDLFDRHQLNGVIATCQKCHTLSEAGRKLFAQSRLKKSNQTMRIG